MQEEIVIPFIVFSFIALVVKMALDHAKWKAKHRSTAALMDGEGDKGMRVSELRALIQDAVLEAQEPLVARIDDLEMALRLLPEVEESRASEAGNGRRDRAASEAVSDHV